MNVSDVLARIPYLKPHALRIDEVGGDIHVRMPIRPELTNHVGIFHAGALFTAAETAAGVAAWKIIPDDRAFVLLKAANVRYTRRAEGDVLSVAKVKADEADAARKTFDATQKGEAQVEVTMIDPHGEVVFVATFNYALRPRKK